MTKQEKAIERTANNLRSSTTTVRAVVEEYNRAMKDLTPPRKPRKKTTKKGK